VILPYINSITLTGRTLRYPTNATAEEQAVRWLIEEDVTTNTTAVRSLRQRYVLATVYFQNKLSLRDWLTSEDECLWLLINCASGDVTRLVPLGETGPIPPDLALLTTLVNLDLDGLVLQEGLTGTIPSTLGLLTRLTELKINANQLTGTIPSSLGSLTALKRLVLSDNLLTGTIPSSLGSLTALTDLWLYNNRLTGSVLFCDGDSSRFDNLEIDCNEVTCPCCTACCPGAGWDGIPPRLNGCDA
jgi:hypothetical protein